MSERLKNGKTAGKDEVGRETEDELVIVGPGKCVIWRLRV